MEAYNTNPSGHTRDQPEGWHRVFVGPSWLFACGLGAILGGFFMRDSSFRWPLMLLGAGVQLVGATMLYRNIKRATRRGEELVAAAAAAGGGGGGLPLGLSLAAIRFPADLTPGVGGGAADPQGAVRIPAVHTVVLKEVVAVRHTHINDTQPPPPSPPLPLKSPKVQGGCGSTASTQIRRCVCGCSRSDAAAAAGGGGSGGGGGGRKCRCGCGRFIGGPYEEEGDGAALAKLLDGGDVMALGRPLPAAAIEASEVDLDDLEGFGVGVGDVESDLERSERAQQQQQQQRRLQQQEHRPGGEGETQPLDGAAPGVRQPVTPAALAAAAAMSGADRDGDPLLPLGRRKEWLSAEDAAAAETAAGCGGFVIVLQPRPQLMGFTIEMLPELQQQQQQQNQQQQRPQQR